MLAPATRSRALTRMFHLLATEARPPMAVSAASRVRRALRTATAAHAHVIRKRRFAYAATVPARDRRTAALLPRSAARSFVPEESAAAPTAFPTTWRVKRGQTAAVEFVRPAPASPSIPRARPAATRVHRMANAVPSYARAEDVKSRPRSVRSQAMSAAKMTNAVRACVRRPQAQPWASAPARVRSAAEARLSVRLPESYAARVRSATPGPSPARARERTAAVARVCLGRIAASRSVNRPLAVAPLGRFAGRTRTAVAPME